MLSKGSFKLFTTLLSKLFEESVFCLRKKALGFQNTQYILHGLYYFPFLTGISTRSASFALHAYALIVLITSFYMLKKSICIVYCCLTDEIP